MDIDQLFSKKNLFSSKKALVFYIDNISDVILGLDSNLNIIYANKSFCRLMVCEKKDLINKKLDTFLDKQSIAKLLLICKPESEISFKTDLVFRANNSAEKWLSLTIHNFKKGFIIIGKDFTEEKVKNLERNEEIGKIEEEKARSQEILDSIGDGVVSVNDKGEIVYVNHQAVDILGFQQEEILGELMWRKIIMYGPDNKEVSVEKRPIRLALFSRNRIYENTYFYKSKDGRLVPVSVTATPLIVHNLVVGGVDVFRDITKEREIDKMKTEFISLASHQLRTPLSATKWFAELLMDDAKILNAEQYELIGNIYKSNQRMIDLVNSLLNISRIESGRIIIDPKPTDLRKLVEDVITELKVKINEKKHNVTLTVSGDLPTVNIDPRLIRNVYMNLLTNSIKYTREKGEIRVDISKQGEDVVSKVSDNGLGIPNSQKQRIFEKFFRSSNITKVETDGSGLGLYLAKAIVESSGGKIWFESEEYKGSEFWFTLPMSGTPAKKGEVSID